MLLVACVRLPFGRIDWTINQLDKAKEHAGNTANKALDQMMEATNSMTATMMEAVIAGTKVASHIDELRTEKE